MASQSVRLHYVLLTVISGLAFCFTLQGVLVVWDQTFHSASAVRTPLSFGFRLNQVSGMTEAARRTGLPLYAPVVAFNGRPFTSYEIYAEELRKARPGSTLATTFLTPTHEQRIVLVPLQESYAGQSLGWFHIFAQDIVLRILLPLACFLLGTWVVFAKPRDINAWFLFGIFNYFATTIYPSVYFPGLPLYIVPIISDVLNTLGPVCIMLFGIYFPHRSSWDIRHPWAKWVVLAPVLVALPLDLWFTVGYTLRFSLAPQSPTLLAGLARTESVLVVLAISWFFASVIHKIVVTQDSDSRRRLKTLCAGAAIASLPTVALVLYSLLSTQDFGVGIPQWLELSSISLFAVLPVTLAYVVVVQRAMELPILVRQGTKYLFARTTLRVVSALLVAWGVWSIVTLFRHRGDSYRAAASHLLLALAALAACRALLSKKVEDALDRRFFREAYSTEQLLSELSEEMRSFTATAPLLQTLIRRICETLHVAHVAIFLRAGDHFQLSLSNGLAVNGLPPANLFLSGSSAMVRSLAETHNTATLYQHGPSGRLDNSDSGERELLAKLSSELLVPLTGRRSLVGIIALGAKRSEEPYSATDRHLLKTVGSQTGLALENAELFASLTAELAQRERVARELEIAREVQQHLLPRTFPTVPGLDLTGYCRPAYAVGGDYYDLFLSGDKLVVAIGDISGKGISASLLMASLRAALRSAVLLRAPAAAPDLASLIAHLNSIVYESSTSNRYATFFLAELDLESLLLTYVNAGHNPPAVFRGGETLTLAATGTVVGLIPDMQYSQGVVQLHRGDVFLAYTDGISESMTQDEEEWGEQRLFAATHFLLTKRAGHISASDLVQSVLAEVDRFANGAPQHDDMTLLACIVQHEVESA